MKYIKTYEKKDSPSVGDFVLITLTDDSGSVEPYIPIEFEEFLNTTIGKVIRIEPDLSPPNIKIMYKSIPGFKSVKDTQFNPNTYFYKYNDGFGLWVSEKNILHRSRSRKELELFLDMGKYNL